MNLPTKKVLLKMVTTNYRGNNIVIDNINLFNENELNIINVSNRKIIYTQIQQTEKLILI